MFEYFMQLCKVYKKVVYCALPSHRHKGVRKRKVHFFLQILIIGEKQTGLDPIAFLKSGLFFRQKKLIFFSL